MGETSLTSFMLPLSLFLPLASAIQIGGFFSLVLIFKLCYPPVYRSNLLILFSAQFSLATSSSKFQSWAPILCSSHGLHGWGTWGCHSPPPVILFCGLTMFCLAFLLLTVPAVSGIRETIAVSLNFITGISAEP